MDDQLKWITGILEHNDIPYWVDSGTLLGLVREGDVMSHDKDIDLACWGEHKDRILTFGKRFRTDGYKFTYNTYRGTGYSLKLAPKDKRRRDITIGFHYRDDGQAWRLATFFVDNPHPPGSIPFFLKGLWRFPLRTATSFLRNHVPAEHLVANWPSRLVLQAGVWRYPVEIVENTIIHPDTGLRIPERWFDYLKLRYGDWHEPVRQWRWYRDDHAAVVGLPENLVNI